MDSQVRKQLIDALKSGKYKWTEGRLRQDDCFCVLGVLCDISGLGTWSDDESYIVEGDDDPLFCTPPLAVTRWAGLAHDEMNQLWIINDDSTSYDRVIRYLEQTCENQSENS